MYVIRKLYRSSTTARPRLDRGSTVAQPRLNLGSSEGAWGNRDGGQRAGVSRLDLVFALLQFREIAVKMC